jgi:Tfp pilus assembly protein PilP
MSAGRIVVLAALVLLVGADVLAAQQARPRRGRPTAADTATAAPVREIELKFDREVFLYSAEGRRDPFVPLVSGDAELPRYENFILTGVMYSPTAGQSLAIIFDDKGKKSYRVRRGDIVGNSRVLNIAPSQILLAVDSYGVVKQETLELQKDPKGATR